MTLVLQVDFKYTLNTGAGFEINRKGLGSVAAVGGTTQVNKANAAFFCSCCRMRCSHLTSPRNTQNNAGVAVRGHGESIQGNRATAPGGRRVLSSLRWRRRLGLSFCPASEKEHTDKGRIRSSQSGRA
jgi:hypothetical protein